MQSQKIKIVIAEDQQLLRQTLAAMLNEIKDFLVTYSACSGNELLEYLKTERSEELILLLDIGLPDINGLELCDKIVKNFPLVRIIIVTVYKQESLIAKMMSLGASAYLHKNTDINVLAQAIRAVHEHKFYLDENIIRILQDSRKQQLHTLTNSSLMEVDLSVREIEILTLICRELSSNEIAERLFISMRTVEGHRNRLMLKTGSKNVAGLVLFAIRNNLVELI